MIRGVRTQSQLQSFQASAAHASLCGLVARLSEAVAGKGISHDVVEFEGLAPALAALDALVVLVDAVPPEKERQRFGNAAFRTWHERMAAVAPEAMATLLPGESADGAAIVELVSYWTTAFGNPQRIDFGTGHEAAFVMWLHAWLELSGDTLDGADARVLEAIGLRIVPAYLRVARKVQTVYCLEPAGSHGVWSLDDYHLLPFLLGSAQLDGHPQSLTPRSALSDEVVECYAGEFLYYGAVNYVKQVKRGARFDEVAPLLSTIAKRVPKWGAINDALRQMFAQEVLGKFPVAQHFLFGATLPCNWLAADGAAGASSAAVPVRSVSTPRPGARARPVGAGAGSSVAGGAAAPSGMAPWAKPPPGAEHVFRSPGDSVLQKYFGLGQRVGSKVEGAERGTGAAAGGATVRGWEMMATSAPLAGTVQLAKIEAAGADFPLPEMVFDRNVVTLRHSASGFEVQLDATSALLGQFFSLSFLFFPRFISFCESSSPSDLLPPGIFCWHAKGALRSAPAISWFQRRSCGRSARTLTRRRVDFMYRYILKRILLTI